MNYIRKALFWTAFIPLIMIMLILGFLVEPLMAIYDWFCGRMEAFEKWALDSDEQ